MKKEELEKLLSTDSEDFELYPIDRYLRALASERRMPDLAIGVCTIRIEEAAPALRAVLARAANGEVLAEDDERLLFRGLHILGGARDTQACQSLLRLLRRPAPNSTTCSATPSRRRCRASSQACSTAMPRLCSAPSQTAMSMNSRAMSC
ncbi:hypothetical protein [Mesorhizobium sp. NFR06]|uniref:hypothetical protein n=1 Tax=Mesorhizobium sp. NFR06 TaxID=1566290 RepID=UPI00165F59BD|nr:hypothetical protein [Mesorhizobium sp. NFR06]